MNLRVLPAGPGAPGHEGEVFCCAFTADGRHLLSGGWDGQLRLWECATQSAVAAFPASHKPISACACAPDGKYFLSGCLEGFVTLWDAASQQPAARMLAHPRPVSGICHAAAGGLLATASWDRSLVLWELSHELHRERARYPLVGHTDIVAGCRFLPGGQSLLSWSHDGTLILWDVATAQRRSRLTGHQERVTAAAVAPDGAWIASGSRDHTIKLWEPASQKELASWTLDTEVRACCFLRDGAALVAVNAHGRLTVHALPTLEVRAELTTRLAVQCAELAPPGDQIALGCDDGQVRFIAVDGFDELPLLVSATRTAARPATGLQRFFGKSRPTEAYQCTCPVCRQAIELPGHRPEQPVSCPSCQRRLRVTM